MTHTPGPWKWGDGHRGLYGQGEGRQREVLTFEPYENMWLSYTDHQESNASLIAAAPDLLEALEYIRQNCFIYCDSSMDIDNTANQMADAAIRKAKGESS